MSSYYGNYPGASKVFRWANCIQQVTHNENGWDAAYCSEVIIVSVAAAINCSLLSFLLYLDIQK